MIGELTIFLLGLAVGSLLNRCIYRLPAGQPVLGPAKGNVPGSSRARHLIVALLTGALFVWCQALSGLGPELFRALALTSFLVLITFIDYDHQLILDRVLAWLAGAGVAINLALAYWPGLTSVSLLPGLLDMLLGGLTGGGIMLIIALVTRGGMGGGDIKFAAALGLWFGWQLTLLTLLLSFFCGGAGGVAVLALRLKGRKDMIPFGPFIAAGAFAVLLYGRALIAWYLQSYLQ